MSSVRWGILSTANIGVAKVVPAIQKAPNCDVVAIASRDLDRAQHAADQLGIPDAFGSYEQLLERADIDAVYIPLPNDMHAEWTLKAASAGKHILCEKPLAMSSAQAIEMVLGCEAEGVKLQEAFMYRHHPTWVEAIRLVRDGTIGDVQAVHAWFSYFNDDPTDIRNRVANGGGAMMDIGCYPVNVSRLVFDGEPESVRSVVRRDPTMGIDIVTSAILEFPGSKQAAFTCTIRAQPDQSVAIVGTSGRIDIEIPFNIPPTVTTRIFVAHGGEERVIEFPPSDQYTIQAELFAASILDDRSVPVAPTDAVANMAVIEKVLAGG